MNSQGIAGVTDKPFVMITVISTRQSTEKERLMARQAGIRLVDCPGRSYRWITPAQSVCRTIVQSPQNDAWVFTSHRGVEGWRRAWPLEISGVIQPVPVLYLIGQRTLEALQHHFSEDLFRIADIRIPVEHTGVALARRIVADGIRSVIHFCSRKRRPELAKILFQNRVKLQPVEVYDSVTVGKGELPGDPVHGVLFFSPAGVLGFKEAYGLPKGDWKAIAIGPTTARTVKQVTGKTPCVASYPGFKSMIEPFSDRSH